MPDKDDGYYYRRRGYYYGDDDLLGDWSLVILMLFFFAFVLAAALCLYSPGCGMCGSCCYDEDPYRRHVVRYEIVRDGERDSRRGRRREDEDGDTVRV
jgi:hypothetical protein